MIKKWTCIITAFIILFSLPVIAKAASRNEILMKGDKDKYVLELQSALKAQGYLKQEPTGYFGTDTMEALIAFQKKKGLKADGKAGTETRKALLKEDFKPITEARSVQEKSEDKLYPGDKNDEVGELQQLLKKLGYYKYSKITGYYGPSTQEAVRRFQRTNGLEMDGVVGQTTQDLLKSGNAKYYTIYYKDKGADIEEMQKRLKALGYYNKKITGYFGAETLAALKEFQKNNGLKADGKAGKNTLNELDSKKALKASKTVKKPSEPDKPKQSEAPPKEVAGATKTEKLINFAKTLLGKKYSRGAEGPARFDCSGFTLYCFKYIGMSLPRTSANMSVMEKYPKIENISDLAAGDLVFFRTSKKSSIGHVGIAIGGNKFIHCAPGVGVQIREFVKDSYYYRQFRWGRRVL